MYFLLSGLFVTFFSAGVHGSLVSLTNASQCVKTVTIELSSNITAVGYEVGQNLFTNNKCPVTFKARGRNGRLCLGIEKLNIANVDYKVVIYDGISSNSTNKSYSSRNLPSVPLEWCSTGQYVRFVITRESDSDSQIYDSDNRPLDLQIQVRHINQNRTVYLSGSCGSEYLVLDSFVIVKSRAAAGTLARDCSAVFRYIGTEDKMLCATFVSHVSTCTYELKVHHGDLVSSLFSHKYECSETPKLWCSRENSLILEISRTENESRNLFSVEIHSRDTYELLKPTTLQPEPDDEKNILLIFLITVIILGVIFGGLGIIAIVILFIQFKSDIKNCCCKKQTVKPKTTEEVKRQDEKKALTSNTDDSPTDSPKEYTHRRRESDNGSVFPLKDTVCHNSLKNLLKKRSWLMIGNAISMCQKCEC